MLNEVLWPLPDVDSSAHSRRGWRANGRSRVATSRQCYQAQSHRLGTLVTGDDPNGPKAFGIPAGADGHGGDLKGLAPNSPDIWPHHLTHTAFCGLGLSSLPWIASGGSTEDARAATLDEAADLNARLRADPQLNIRKSEVELSDGLERRRLARWDRNLRHIWASIVSDDVSIREVDRQLERN